MLAAALRLALCHCWFLRSLQDFLTLLIARASGGAEQVPEINFDDSLIKLCSSDLISSEQSPVGWSRCRGVKIQVVDSSRFSRQQETAAPKSTAASRGAVSSEEPTAEAAAPPEMQSGFEDFDLKGSLILDFNYIKKLGKLFFANGLSSLQNLSIRNNHLSFIEDFALTSLTN